MTDQLDKLSSLKQTNNRAIEPKSSKVYLLLPLLVGFFVVMFLWSNWELFQSKIDVKVVSAVAIKSHSYQSMAPESTLFQAAGWVEADPYAVKITPFVSGIVDQVNVLDGESVKKGQILTLINSEDLTLQLRKSEAKKLQADNLVQIKNSELKKSRQALIQLDLEILAKKRAEEKQFNVLKNYRENQKNLSKLTLEQAELAYQQAKAETEAIQAKRAVLNEDIVIKNGAYELAKSELVEQQIAVQKAELDVARCQVKAPTSGTVMKLSTSPGSTASLTEPLMLLYSPESLQVRVDVLFADAPALQLQQQTLITFDAVPNQTFKGVVTSIVGEADLQRNTIQAKIKINKPLSVLRPEMLARVKFLSVAKKELVATTDKNSVITVIPQTSLMNRGQNEAVVWVVSRRNKVAQKRSVQLGGERENGWIEVGSGVNPGEWVVDKPSSDLVDNSPVKIKE